MASFRYPLGPRPVDSVREVGLKLQEQRHGHNLLHQTSKIILPLYFQRYVVLHIVVYFFSRVRVNHAPYPQWDWT